MRYLTQNTHTVVLLFLQNVDRFLAPLMIVAALTLAGWVLSLS